jgi:hypothetical protein
MNAFLVANWGVRFLLELGAFAALAYWGVQTGESAVVKLVLAAGAAGLAVLVWGKLVAPRSASRLEDPARVCVEAAVFGAAAVGLVAADQAALGVLFAAVAALNTTLVRLLDRA